MTRHFLDLGDCGPAGIEAIVCHSLLGPSPLLSGQSVAMIFEKPSARTRNATEMAVVHLGGHAVMITDAEVGIDRRESAEDVARTLACFHGTIAARVRDHRVLTRMANALDSQGLDVNMVNLLSDYSHPCQAIADMLTLADEFGGVESLRGRKLVYVGDANNVALSLAQAGLALGVSVTICAPDTYQFADAVYKDLTTYAQHGATLERETTPEACVNDADALYTDVWTSMGQEHEADERQQALTKYAITEHLMALAKRDAIVMHCLPAHRGEEIAEAVLDSPNSRVWSQAKHRETAMYGIFAWTQEVL